ncbi:MAG: sodium/solute symporter [bacterium]
MTGLDWSVIAGYLAFLIGLGAYLNRGQLNTHDYFLAGQDMVWWQTGFSTMATQLSAVSFISAPAFVALVDNGGLRWLAYEFAVPLALVVVMAVIIPVLHRGNYISMHQYLGERFDEGTRLLVSGLFLLMRGLSSGVIVFAGAKVLAAVVALSVPEAILLIGIVTIIYDVLGGIGVVILSDVVQMAIIFVGLLYCGYEALGIIGWTDVVDTFAADRTQIILMDNYGFNPESSYGFWPFLIGGFVLYVSYYGCDQSQVQREMSVSDEDGVRKSMLLNAFGRFPLVLVYCFVGLVVGAVFLTAPEVPASDLTMTTSELTNALKEKPDYMLPYFIVSVLPSGLSGLLIAAIMAALMSSLDSAMNSLSAITVQDFYRQYAQSDRSRRHYLNAGRFFTFAWGAFATLSALLFHYRGQVKTVIEQINQVGNMFYGPLAAAFLLGILVPWIRPAGIKLGIVMGLVVDIAVWQLAPFVSWLWWGPIGLVTSTATAVVVRMARAGPALGESDLISFEVFRQQHGWSHWYVVCVVYFFVIIAACYGIEVTL